jgi:L-arabinonolactonase
MPRTSRSRWDGRLRSARPPFRRRKGLKAELFVDARCTLGEGIVWDERRRALLWTDIEGARLWMRRPEDAVAQTWALPDRLGSLAVCESGDLLLALAKGLYLADFDPARDGLPLTMLIHVEADSPRTRINDGRTDRDGNFVFGTMDDREHSAAIGSFYQYSSRRGLRRLDLGHVAIANSICFSLDGRTMYFCDSPQRRIMQCRYDANAAAISDVRVFADFGSDQHFPDGSVIDAEGCLWNAEWGSGVVRRYSLAGAIDREITLPAKNPTCLAFGGPDLDHVYITSARQEMSEDELARTADAGGVYRAFAGGLRGVADSIFLGS